MFIGVQQSTMGFAHAQERYSKDNASWLWVSSPAQRQRRSGPDKGRHTPAAQSRESGHKYRVELFPHFGQGAGILDRFGHELEFPSAFRQTRQFVAKGIVKLGGIR